MRQVCTLENEHVPQHVPTTVVTCHSESQLGNERTQQHQRLELDESNEYGVVDAVCRTKESVDTTEEIHSGQVRQQSTEPGATHGKGSEKGIGQGCQS